MFCKKCGTKISDTAVFCFNCGYKLVVNTENKPNPIEEEPETTSEVEQCMPETEVVDTISEETSDASVEEAQECGSAEEIIEESDSGIISDESDAETLSVIEEHKTEEEIPSSNYTDPVSEEEPPKTMAGSLDVKNKYKRGALAHIGSAVLSVVLAAFMIVTVVVAIIQRTVDSETISNMITNIDLRDIEVDDVADIRELEKLGLKCESDNVLDIIYDNIDQTALASPLTKKEFTQIVENEVFSTYIGEVLGDSLERLTEGKSANIITIDDICDFLEDEKETITEIVGYEITDERIYNLRLTLETNYSDLFDSMKVVDIRDSVGKPISALIVVLFSDWLLIVLIIIDVLLAVLIFLIMRSFRLGMIYFGITSTGIGTIFTVSSLLVLFGIVTLFADGIVGEIITQIISVLLWDVIVISCSMLFIGIVMLIVAKLIKKSAERRRVIN